MKKLLQPQVLIPLVLGIAILAALLAFSNVKKVLALMVGFQRLDLLFFLLLMIAYEAIRCTQWHFLLKKLDIHVPLRAQVFSFAGGEVTKSMPIGNYFQNYILQVAEGTDFGLSSAATTLIVLTEVAVSLIGVVILGLGSWTSWLRPLIIIGVAVFAGLVWLFVKLHHAGRPPRWVMEHRLTRKGLAELRNLWEGAEALLHPRTLLIQSLLGAAYLVAGGAGLYVVVNGLGVHGVSFPQALAVYLFSLGFGLIFPLPIDIGVTEISGVGAFLAIGVSRDAAVGVMLINRVLGIGASLAISLLVMAALPDQVRAVLRHRSRQKRTKEETEPRQPQHASRH